jgi:hypothetical protein
MSDPHDDCRCHYRPSPEEVADLIARAKRHELGIDFLRHGSQESVAAVFGVHAFTVDAARRELAGGGPDPRESG